MVILNRMGMRRTSGQRSGARSQDDSDGTSNNPSESPSIGFPWQLTSDVRRLGVARAARVLLGSRVPQRRLLVIHPYFAGRDPAATPPHSRPRPTVMAGHPGSLWCRSASSFLRRYRRYLASMRRVDRFGSSSRMWHRTRPISTGSFPRLFIP